MNAEDLLLEITKPERRPDPFPLYAAARAAGITRQADGAFLVGGHRDVTALLHDPRISSDPNNVADPLVPPPPLLPFLLQDPPDHDRLRRVTMRQFGPPGRPDLVSSLEPAIAATIDGLLTGLAGRTELDVVDDFAYPLPVTVICELLGVPPADEPRFHQWADAIVRGAGAADQENAADLVEHSTKARNELADYLGQLVIAQREQPADNLLSNLANDPADDHLSDFDLLVTGVLLLVAGHETTVNLIANGTLTMLRHPEVISRLRDEPGYALRYVEEVMRMEPPVQYLANRVATADIEIAGTTIPKGARVVLLLAGANRDPDCFRGPETFDPDRRDNQHFGFGGGIHFCFGAPLARLEAQLALTALARRLRNPRLLADPPPYRPSPVLRGPLHLPVAVDGVDA